MELFCTTVVLRRDFAFPGSLYQRTDVCDNGGRGGADPAVRFRCWLEWQGTTPQGREAMPMHDWTRVEPGIFHAFHHFWISAVSDVLNRITLPPDYYALPAQIATGFDPDVSPLLFTA